jgi:putative zinc finger/helix-turn-helix YgiT family protein
MKKEKKIEEVEFKNCKFNVELEYYYDEDIEEYYVDKELGNKNLRNIRNEYRRKNGLLLDYNIKQIRDKYKLSQKDFALLLGLGEVTITRYESKTVQDKSQDEIIRNSKNPEYFLKMATKNKEKFIKEYDENKYQKIIEIIQNNISKNFIELEYERRDFDASLVGNQKIDLDKIYAIIKVFCDKIECLTKTKLAKFLWYLDFISYKNYNKGITGLSYCHLPYGAVPFLYEELINSDNIKIETIYQGDMIKKFITDVISDSKLSDDELIIIEEIIEKFKNMSTEEVVEYMHKEKAYTQTRKNEFISYQFAEDISL